MVSVVIYVLIPVVLVFLRKYRVYKWGKCRSTTSLEGKVFIVTGANSGIGRETVRELARRKARIIMACRDMTKAGWAIEDIRRTETYGELIPMELDLASLDSVRRFATNVIEQFPKIHVLINNAGVYFPVSREISTNDNFEVHLGVNHLGHFLLTNLLLPKLKDSAPSRVVNVSSSLFERSIETFDPNSISPGYVSSKVCNILFNVHLAKLTEGTGVCVYAVCPGFTYTGLFRTRAIKWYHYAVLAPVAFFYMRTASQGAQSVVYCAISEDVQGETGLIYRDCRHYKSKKKISSEKAAELWKVSNKMVKIQ